MKMKKTTIQNTHDAEKAVLRGKFIAIEAFLKKKKLNLLPYIKKRIKCKVSRRKEIIKIKGKKLQ